MENPFNLGNAQYISPYAGNNLEQMNTAIGGLQETYDTNLKAASDLDILANSLAVSEADRPLLAESLQPVNKELEELAAAGPQGVIGSQKKIAYAAKLFASNKDVQKLVRNNLLQEKEQEFKLQHKLSNPDANWLEFGDGQPWSSRGEDGKIRDYQTSSELKGDWDADMRKAMEDLGPSAESTMLQDYSKVAKDYASFQDYYLVQTKEKGISADTVTKYVDNVTDQFINNTPGGDQMYRFKVHENLKTMNEDQAKKAARDEIKKGLLSIGTNKALVHEKDYEFMLNQETVSRDKNNKTTSDKYTGDIVWEPLTGSGPAGENKALETGEHVNKSVENHQGDNPYQINSSSSISKMNELYQKALVNDDDFIVDGSITLTPRQASDAVFARMGEATTELIDGVDPNTLQLMSIYYPDVSFPNDFKTDPRFVDEKGRLKPDAPEQFENIYKRYTDALKGMTSGARNNPMVSYAKRQFSDDEVKDQSAYFNDHSGDHHYLVQGEDGQMELVRGNDIFSRVNVGSLQAEGELGSLNPAYALSEENALFTQPTMLTGVIGTGTDARKVTIVASGKNTIGNYAEDGTPQLMGSDYESSVFLNKIERTEFLGVDQVVPYSLDNPNQGNATIHYDKDMGYSVNGIDAGSIVGSFFIEMGKAEGGQERQRQFVQNHPEFAKVDSNGKVIFENTKEASTYVMSILGHTGLHNIKLSKDPNGFVLVDGQSQGEWESEQLAKSVQTNSQTSENQSAQKPNSTIAPPSSTTQPNNPDATGVTPPTGLEGVDVPLNEIPAVTEEDRQPGNNTASLVFKSNLGKLPSPIEGGTIYSGFGINTIKGYPGIKNQNRGVDFAVKPGTPMQAVEEGTVTAIINLDGARDGSNPRRRAVVVSHGNYRTVYSNLGDINVKKGDTVGKGMSVGTVGFSSTDDELGLPTTGHFEILEITADGTFEHQDPSKWFKQ